MNKLTFSFLIITTLFSIGNLLAQSSTHSDYVPTIPADRRVDWHNVGDKEKPTSYNQVFNVLNYNAVPNDGLDDRQAIQSAISAQKILPNDYLDLTKHKSINESTFKKLTPISDTLEVNENRMLKNLLFGELGGNGLGLSLNYERYFTNKISIRAGFGTGNLEGLTFPLLINYSLEIPIEIGIGILPYSHIKESDFFNNSSSILIASSLGFKRINKNFVFKASFTPFFNPDNSKFKFYAGISLGLSF